MFVIKIPRYTSCFFTIRMPKIRGVIYILIKIDVVHCLAVPGMHQLAILGP